MRQKEMKVQATGTTPLRAARSVGLALIVGLLATLLAGGLLSPLELAAGDLLFRLRGPLDQESATVMVAIDDASFTNNDLQWPWPRDYIAQIIDNIASGQPKVIAIDIFFYEPSDPEADAALAQAIADAGNVILVNDISVQTGSAFALQQLNRPIPELDEAAATLGLTNFPRDADGTVRRLLAFQVHNEQSYYSWAMHSARMYLDEDTFQRVSPDEVRIGDRSVTLQSQYLQVNLGGPAQSVPIYSAYQVADGLIDPERFAGKIVIIGATSESLHDTYPTAFGSEPPMPGAEINAHAIDTILDGRFIRIINPPFPLLLALLAALVGTGLVLRLRPLAGLGTVVALLLVYSIIATILFAQARLRLPMTAPLLAVGLTFVAGTSINLYEEQRQRAHVHSLFSRYVAPAAIDQMLTQPESYALRGQRREMSILFSDIRGFTTISEKLDPDEVVEILNEYLSAMTEIVFKYEGIIDKFEGDAILAVYNAPLTIENHATKAVQSAVEMMERLTVLQAKWAAQGKEQLEIGVGINTGLAFVGNIGSMQRMDYTVIGDTVNLASRLETLTKERGIPILFTEATRDQLDPSIKTRFVATANVKGRAQPVNLYTVEDSA
jgi:adenylate cyclase